MREGGGRGGGGQEKEKKKRKNTEKKSSYIMQKAFKYFDLPRVPAEECKRRRKTKQHSQMT